MFRDVDVRPSQDASPIVVFGYPAVGDFVRCHTLIRMIAARHPNRPIDVVTRAPSVELVAFMPEVREAIAENFRHRRLTLSDRFDLAQQLRRRGYGSAYIIPSSFKAALVPFFALIPNRIGWVVEWQWPLINRPRFGMHGVPRMVDRLAMLGLDPGDRSLAAWPSPRLVVPASLQPRFDALSREARSRGTVVALAPGSSDVRKNWTVENFAQLARHCADRGATVWIVGSAAEGALARAIGALAPVEDRTENSVTNLALNIAAADAFVGNDSGPLHVAAALGKPCVGLFGLSDPYYTAPINDAVEIPIPSLTLTRRTRSEVYYPAPEQVIAALDRQLERVKREAPAEQPG